MGGCGRSHPTSRIGRGMSADLPDFDRLISEARARPRPVPIEEARRTLGALFDEFELAQETLVIPWGADPALTPTTWIRVVRRAKEIADRT